MRREWADLEDGGSSRKMRTLSCSTVMWRSNRRSDRVSGETTKTLTMLDDMFWRDQRVAPLKHLLRLMDTRPRKTVSLETLQTQTLLFGIYRVYHPDHCPRVFLCHPINIERGCTRGSDRSYSYATTREATAASVECRVPQHYNFFPCTPKRSNVC